MTRHKCPHKMLLGRSRDRGFHFHWFDWRSSGVMGHFLHHSCSFGSGRAHGGNGYFIVRVASEFCSPQRNYESHFVRRLKPLPSRRPSYVRLVVTISHDEQLRECKEIRNAIEIHVRKNLC